MKWFKTLSKKTLHHVNVSTHAVKYKQNTINKYF